MRVNIITINTPTDEIEYKPDTIEEAQSIEGCVEIVKMDHPDFTSLVIVVLP